MVRDDLGHEYGDFVRGVEFARFFARVCGKHADEILVNEAKHIVALASIHRNVFDELNKIADGLGLPRGVVAEFAQAGFQGLENALEETLVIRVNEAAEGRQGIAHMGDIKIAFLIDPGGEEVRVGKEITEVALEMINGFLVILGKAAEIVVAEALVLREAHQFIRKVFVEDEPENVVLVFVCLDLRAHLVGRFPDFGGELLFIHGG